jgi:AraC-like DNA-binding protein
MGHHVAVSLSFEVRPASSPLIDCVWRTSSGTGGRLTSVASAHWHVVVGRIDGRVEVSVHGPESTFLDTTMPPLASWIGIRFRLGTVPSGLAISRIVDGGVTLPDGFTGTFRWHGTSWQLPTYDDAECLVQRWEREDLIGRDPIVEEVLRGARPELSLRTVQRRFVSTTGLPHRAVRQIELARLAAVRLRDGAAPAEVTYELGYYDQAHLTRSLRRYLGSTPATLANPDRTGQLSLLYKTDEATGPSLGFDDTRDRQSRSDAA